MSRTDEHVELCTLREAAARLRVSERTIYNWIYSGDLATVKIGRARRVLMQSITDFIDRSIDQQLVASQ